MTIQRQWVDILEAHHVSMGAREVGRICSYQGPGVGSVELFEYCWLVAVELACGAEVAVDVVGPGVVADVDVVGPVARFPKLGALFPELGQTPWYHFWMVDISVGEHFGQTP